MEQINISKHFICIKANNEKFYGYNSIVGGLKELSSKEIECIDKINKAEKLNQSDLHIVEELKKYHFIDNQKYKDDYELLYDIKKKYKNDVESGASITKLLLYVTGNCMLRCSYCYIDDATEMDVNETGLNCSKGMMTWETAKSSIDTFFEIVELHNQDKLHVRFFGGEPLMNFPIIKKSIEYINDKYSDKKVVFHLNTNGLGMTDEVIDCWVKNSINGLHSTDIDVSVDGPQEIHDKMRIFPNGQGSYKLTMDKVRKLIEKGYPVDKISLACTLTKYNYKYLRELIDQAKLIGIEELEINTLIFESNFDFLDRVEDRIACLIDARKYGIEKGVKVNGKWFKLIERLNNPVLNYCGRVGQQICSDLDGNMFICTGYFKNFGKISNWREVFKSKEYVDLALRIVGELPECRDCSIECVCAGGCPASAESSYGNFYSKEAKECEFRKKMVVELIKNIDSIADDKILFDEVDDSYIPTLKKYKR
jgi:uncharacterized protein